MMVATECWLVHTNTVVKRIAGNITPRAKKTVARMIMKLKVKLRSVEEVCDRWGRAGTTSAAPTSVLSQA